MRCLVSRLRPVFDLWDLGGTWALTENALWLEVKVCKEIVQSRTSQGIVPSAVDSQKIAVHDELKCRRWIGEVRLEAR